MHCYRHQERPAVAVCRNCGKAVCASCCEIAEQKVACSANCEDALQQDALVQDRLERSLGIGSGSAIPVSVYSYALFGLILLFVASYVSATRLHADYLSFAMSAVFFVMAALSYTRFRKACHIC